MDVLPFLLLCNENNKHTNATVVVLVFFYLPSQCKIRRRRRNRVEENRVNKTNKIKTAKNKTLFSGVNNTVSIIIKINISARRKKATNKETQVE